MSIQEEKVDFFFFFFTDGTEVLGRTTGDSEIEGE